MLTNNTPAIINEYNSMLRPLKIGEPDAIWNLLSIVRDMYRKNDRNALPLLEIITDEMTNCIQVSAESIMMMRLKLDNSSGCFFFLFINHF